MASLPLFLVLFVALIACGETSASHDAHQPAPQAEAGSAEPSETAPRASAGPVDLSETARQGESVFNTHCAQCHGQAAAGTNLGPTLIDRIYHPGHHGDAAFHLAVLRGVRQHHWQFGNMLPVPGVSEAQVNQIICYVRHLQRTAGIFTPTEYQRPC